MNKKNKTLKTYKCYINEGYGELFSKLIVATTGSKAKYQCWVECDDAIGEWKDIVKIMKVKSLGKLDSARINISENDLYEFNAFKIARSIPFVEIGMKIDVAGKKGVIVGSNYSLNLDIIFDEDENCSRENCHPYWETTYYNNEGEIIKDYKSNL